MEVDDPIAISMAIDEKLMVIDGSLNDNQQQHNEVNEVVGEKEKEKQKTNDDRKQTNEKNMKINENKNENQSENENVQAVNINVYVSKEKEENDIAKSEEANLGLPTLNKLEILHDNQSDIAEKNNEIEKVEKKKENKESCANGNEKLKPNLRRKLSSRSSSSPLKQVEQQEVQGQREQDSPVSTDGNNDLLVAEDEDSEGVTATKRKRHNVRKSGSDEYLLGFDEQSGEAELIKMDIDAEDTNANISSGSITNINASSSIFKLNKAPTGLTVTDKLSESETEMKQEERGNKVINSHVVGDNEETGIINKKSWPQTRNNKTGGPVTKSSALSGIGQTVKRPPQSEYYKKPFTYGWKRELVWRANLETSKDKADVYFISPTGKKLRARSDIIPLLEGDLTIEHFCFAREPLGAGPELEIVRSAKPSSRTTVTAATLAAAPSPTNIGKRISKPKGPKGASPPPQGWTPSQALKVNNAALLSSTNAAHRHSSSYQYHYQHQTTTAATAASSPSSRRGQNSEAHHQQPLSHTPTSISAVSHSVSSSGSGNSNSKTSSKLKKSIATTTAIAITATTGITGTTVAVTASNRQQQQQQQQISQRQHLEINSNMLTATPMVATATVTATSVPISATLAPINSSRSNTATETAIATTVATTAIEAITAPTTTIASSTTPSTTSLRKEVCREPCSVKCVKAPGLVPQLQCIKCLCHYHHQCVNQTIHNTEYRTAYNSKGKDYVCEKCREKDKLSLHKKLTSTAVIRRTAIENSGNKYHPQTIAVVKAKKYVMVAKSLLSTSGNQQVNDIENDLKQINESIRQHRKHSLEMGKVTTMTSSGATVTTSVNSSNINNNSNNNHIITTTQEHQHINKMFVSNFFANISYAYGALLNILKYLKIHERSRAASVCKLWNLAAKDTSLWRTVRMKNSKVCSWSGFVAALRRGETKHLDLRKMLLSNTRSEEFWLDFSQHIGTVCSLEIIDLCRCSGRVVENLFLSNPNLKILNAMAINDDILNLDNINNLQNLKELRLRPCELLTLSGDLMPLATLSQLTHLSLTALRGLGGKCIEILSELSELKSLELGECGDFEPQFANDVLPKLLKLQRLRLENGQQTNCCTLTILDGLAQLPQLDQLELVNFDIKTGFDEKLRLCRHLTKLMIIPTYISQSATTNRIVLNAVQQVADTLKYFTWVVTVELLRVTALYVDQCEESMKKEKHHFDECIPVLKPVPGAPPDVINDDADDVKNINDEKPNDKNKMANPLATSIKDVDMDDCTEEKIKSEEKEEGTADVSMADGNEVPQIEILPLDKVEMILAENLPNTKFTIVKVPYHQTSKQHLVE